MATATKGTTKDDIIRALLDTSFSRSAGATSMNDIAACLGMKKASLYNHISGREQLVAETLDSCAAYISQITFIPEDFVSICRKYPAQTVLKGIAERYFKMHERNPLFQIYTFVESMKYFDERAARIIQDEEKALEEQASRVLSALSDEGKVPLDGGRIASASRWFCSGLRTMLGDWLLGRKKIVMENPASGEGELFTLPQDEKTPAFVETFTEEFLSIIQA